MNRTNKKWTDQEDAILLQQVRQNPQNLSRCFLAVSEQIERSPSAVASHWYTALSKRSDALCFFTASAKHISKNRKNGTGQESTPSIWQRLLAIIRNF